MADNVPFVAPIRNEVEALGQIAQMLRLVVVELRHANQQLDVLLEAKNRPASGSVT
jgi:hypothetical protein